MSLSSRSRGRMLASQGAESCIIGLDITAGIDLSPWSGGALWCLSALCPALQTTRVSAGQRDRYHQVLCLARPPHGLDIQSVCRGIRAEEARLDITLTISILEVWGHGVR
jgi:hypothetical protein